MLLGMMLGAVVVVVVVGGVPLAVVVATLLVWLFVFIQRSPNVSYRSKRVSWLYLLFLGVCVLKVLSLLKSTSH